MNKWMRPWVDIILKNFPSKDEEWAEYQLIRAINNIDAYPDDEVIAEVLKQEFGIEVES